MFDTKRTQQFGKKNDDDSPYNGSSLPSIDHLDEGELILLMDRIEGKLPPLKLSRLNLEEELVRQLMRAKTLQADVIDSDEIAANQKAQVMNSVASTIGALVKMQTDLYNAERFKAVEALMIDALKLMPTDVAIKFLEEYERLAGN